MRPYDCSETGNKSFSAVCQAFSDFNEQQLRPLTSRSTNEVLGVLENWHLLLFISSKPCRYRRISRK